MTLTSLHSLNDAYDAGQHRQYSFRKSPVQTTGAGIWFDLSMSPGNPAPNYYAAAPNISIALAQSTDVGLAHGGDTTSVGTKYLHKLTLMTQLATAVPLPIILCDYLMYYPFVDMSDTAGITLTNSITVPRYTTGAGVQIMAVEVAGQSGVGNPQFNLNYTNSDGVAGRTTQTVACNTQVVNGTIINTAPATALCNSPFLPLQFGDTGVRSIETVNFLSGDVGLISFVLVKPLASMSIMEITAPVERDFWKDGYVMPEIKPDAYLNLICYPSGTLSGGTITGIIETIWA